jgi:pimeloyl-ACP methyl ester carboxylesterase
VSNSGPGVTWASQGRYATEARLAADGASADAIEAALIAYDRVVALVRGGAALETIRKVAEEAGLGGPEPADDHELTLVRRWQDHDPRPALDRIACPILAIFGGSDMIVPVVESAEIYRTAGERPGRRVDVVILPGASHRLQVGSPPGLHPAYLATLTKWILAVATTPGGSGDRID